MKNSVEPEIGSCDCRDDIPDILKMNIVRDVTILINFDAYMYY